MKVAIEKGANGIASSPPILAMIRDSLCFAMLSLSRELSPSPSSKQGKDTSSPNSPTRVRLTVYYLILFFLSIVYNFPFFSSSSYNLIISLSLHIPAPINCIFFKPRTPAAAALAAASASAADAMSSSRFSPRLLVAVLRCLDAMLCNKSLRFHVSEPCEAIFNSVFIRALEERPRDLSQRRGGGDGRRGIGMLDSYGYDTRRSASSVPTTAEEMDARSEASAEIILERLVYIYFYFYILISYLAFSIYSLCTLFSRPWFVPWLYVTYDSSPRSSDVLSNLIRALQICVFPSGRAMAAFAVGGSKGSIASGGGRRMNSIVGQKRARRTQENNEEQRKVFFIIIFQYFVVLFRLFIHIFFKKKHDVAFFGSKTP